MKIRRNHIPFLSTIFHNVNTDIAKIGIHQTFKNLLTLKGCAIQVNGLTSQLHHILQTQRVILVANHPHEIEPIVLLASLPPRADVFVIANVKFLNWLSNLNKHIIPVYIQHHYHRANRLGLRARMLNILPLSDDYVDQNKAHQLNIQSINRASLFIDKGGFVIIFPGVGKTHWFPGVGHLAKNTTTDKPIYLVKASVSKTCRFDLLRLIPGMSKLFPTITIDFAPAEKINRLRKHNGKEIALIMENSYQNWIN